MKTNCWPSLPRPDTNFAKLEGTERWTDRSARVTGSSAGSTGRKTKDLYVIGTVATGTVGEFSLSKVTTTAGLAPAIERGYRNRTPDERVWLFDGAASGHVSTSAPLNQRYDG